MSQATAFAQPTAALVQPSRGRRPASSVLGRALFGLKARFSALLAVFAVTPMAISYMLVRINAAGNETLITETFYELLATAAISIIAGALIGWMFARRIGRAVDAAERLAAGDADVAIPTGERDEIGALWRALGNIRETIGQNLRLSRMVDQMPINVMMADPEDFRINYVNKTSLETLKSIERLLPCKADEMLGQCIDIFHKNPAHQRKLLANPKNLPHHAVIRLGDEYLDLNVSAITDAKGNYSGPMVSWSVVTEKVRADAETARLMTMMDEMPINIMAADPKDFRINYVNKTSLETLRKIEHLLPCKAAEINGQCIDIFHKHPEHQRKLLANPDNLPHNARIKLGEETLSLKVSAIRDKNGSYIGPMVSWSVITGQVKLADDFETNVKGVVDTVSAASTEMQATAQAMSATAEETNRQSTVVAAASEQATNNVQTVASAAEELSASVSEISNQVTQSTRIARSAVEKANGTNAQIQELATAAQKIDEVVKLISDIAAQTNLLALNATIEAARAGDAGKGFAVVASEVKSLANQTAQATDEIASQIAAVQSATTNAVSAIEEITQVISEINEISGAVSAAVEEQGAATQEIARNVQEAAAGTREVSSNISGVTQAASETGTSAQQVLEAASELSRQSEGLSGAVDHFLRQVRAM